MPFVEFRDVTFGYDKRVVLDHLSFKVMDGDQVTLTGRTGAGKSTIFKLLLGLYKPQSGEVLIHGVPAADIRDDERRRLFGCVEQTFHMVPGTVRDQITLYDSTISDEAVHTAAELTGLKDTIESMEKATTRVVPMICSRRVSGSFCPSQELQQPHRACCCSMRSPQTLTPRPNAPCFPL